MRNPSAVTHSAVLLCRLSGVCSSRWITNAHLPPRRCSALNVCNYSLLSAAISSGRRESTTVQHVERDNKNDLLFLLYPCASGTIAVKHETLFQTLSTVLESQCGIIVYCLERPSSLLQENIAPSPFIRKTGKPLFSGSHLSPSLSCSSTAQPSSPGRLCYLAPEKSENVFALDSVWILSIGNRLMEATHTGLPTEAAPSAQPRWSSLRASSCSESNSEGEKSSIAHCQARTHTQNNTQFPSGSLIFGENKKSFFCLAL